MKTLKNFIWVLLFVFLFLSNPVIAQVNIVKVTGGKIEGTIENNISVFKGIPFAAPPVGELRWRPPHPVKNWNGVLKTNEYAPSCFQLIIPRMSPSGQKYSEDCLYLNVWTPAKSSNEKLPVMVWIHGGGFVMGTSNIAGEGLANMGVVVVSISYRLGVFGFMAYPELAAESKNNSGNYGLLDQLAALKWIQKNIHAFGGNPARVTIFGESSGGASVSMLCASHLAKGLFSGVICESGGNFKPTEGTGIKTLKSAEKIGIEFVNKMGVTSIAELRKINPEKWVKDPFTYMDGNFEPFIDGYVITDDQYRLYRNGKYNDVDVIVGTNSDEGGTFSFMNKIKQADYKTTIESTYGPFADKFLKLYSGNTEEQVKTSMSDILRDKNYAWGSWTWVRLQKKTGKGNVFLYYFDQQQPATMMGTVLRGAGHGNEIPYVFKSLDPKKKSEDDLKLSEQMAQYWVNFAKTRNPNGKGLPEWPVFNEDKNTVMYLHVNPEVGPVPNLEKLQLFEEYFNWVRK